jgi:asparagine synthase (glutamine-hydrolysing)
VCGIAGYVGAYNPSLGSTMAAALAHRGPDDEGECVLPAANGSVAVLAHRRLSIIDIAGGHQPLANEDETVHLVFNGEIYNFEELRRELTARGHRLRTRCDSEVLVHLYEDEGVDLVHRLRGMFAFALWDSSRQRLVLARDRLGVKPLYYAEPGGETQLAFASEPAALRAVPDVSCELDPEALAAYLTYLYVPHPLSALRGVRKLPPAHVLVSEAGHVSVRRYWSLEPERSGTSTLAPDGLWNLIDDAVGIRLVADVPVGAFLSGGMDSSTVVAAAAPRRRDFPTFTVVFSDPEERRYDERADARTVADAFGTDHHELEARPRLAELLPVVVRHFGEPFANPTALLAYALSEVTRQHVKVVLDGAGSDELFAGYERFRGAAALRWYSRAPAFARWLMARAAAGVPESTHGRHWLRRGREFVLGPAAADDAYIAWVSVFGEGEREGVLRAEVAEALRGTPPPEQFLRDLLADAPANDLVNRLSFVELQSYLPCNVLEYGDRMSMAHGLEVREPFCDQRLVEEVFALPGSAKLRRLQTKALLRRAVESRLPRRTLAKPKLGFAAPIGVWLRGELRPLVESHLSRERVEARGLVRPAAVSRLVDDLWRGRRDTSLHVWSLVVLEQWLREYADSAA